MRLKWTRTWWDKSADFTAYEGDRQAGRIYRHHDGQWLWFAYLWNGQGESGIAVSKQEAADEVTGVIGAMSREGEDRRNVSPTGAAAPAGGSGQAT